MVFTKEACLFVASGVELFSLALNHDHYETPPLLIEGSPQYSWSNWLFVFCWVTVHRLCLVKGQTEKITGKGGWFAYQTASWRCRL